jgi:hypothetical protein
MSLWVKRCNQANADDHANEYIDCYHRWRCGTATDAQFNTVAQSLQTVLPDDLRLERDPAGAMAGWSLFDVAMIALDQCEDVHEDIFATALAYAAAAATGNRTVPIGIDWDALTDAEVDFVDAWWRRCCEQLPQLNSTGTSEE